MLEVRSVQPLDRYWLRLTLSNGDVVERDVEAVLRGPLFAPVREQRAVFEAAFVDGGTVAWPGEVDIAPETIIWDGPEPVAAPAHPPQRLKIRVVELN
ncbi:MAG: DUF2442 domain-containing protein [Chloroflexota bacterium]